MVMGTASGVGKSTVVLALCRILTKMGYRVAPFKAQNITDNVDVISDGKKIAKSSVLAAMACNVEPHPDMGPILLVPSKRIGVKIILNGEEIKTQNLNEVRAYLFEQAFLAYERLLKSYDIVVVEGAGSPVELNLMNRDIVNMNFATRAKIPVMLIGEIHRGGVFAAVYGTLTLLSEEQRSLVKAVVINKFMGGSAHFGDGKNIMEEITKLPLLGVLPYMSIEIEDEDSLVEGVPKTRESLYADVTTEKRYIILVNSAIDKLATQMQRELDVSAVIKIINEGG